MTKYTEIELSGTEMLHLIMKKVRPEEKARMLNDSLTVSILLEDGRVIASDEVTVVQVNFTEEL